VIATFALDEPQASANSVRFSWAVVPSTPLFHASSFELHFPDWVDVASVPRGLLWIAAIAVLHPLWILLRPCRVVFPITLSDGDAEFWQRMLDAAVDTLEACRDTAFHERCIFFSFAGDPLSEPVPIPESGRSAAAFSGGKDSLLQAALLGELGWKPALVATTSPLPPLRDHLTARRAFVLTEAARRLDMPLIEVRSDARALWENGFAARLGYPLAVSELNDTHLYFASLLIAGAATGATHLFLASEADVQTNAVRDGRFVQIAHVMYSVATQAAISALLAPWNLRYTSLTSPLFNAQVQRLLWTRYPDVAHLQYSCWKVRDEEAACNDCNQCLRMVCGILAAGHDPRAAGFDPGRAFGRAAEWFPKHADPDPRALPERRSRAHLSQQMIENVRAIDPAFARATLDDGGFAAYRAFARRLAAEPPRHLGISPSFAAFIDPAVASDALAIYARTFPGEASADDAGNAARTAEAARAIAAPLERP